MDNLKNIRWKQRFENFDKLYRLLNKYAKQPITTELERAGIIQFFKMTYELARSYKYVWVNWKEYRVYYKKIKFIDETKNMDEYKDMLDRY